MAASLAAETFAKTNDQVCKAELLFTAARRAWTREPESVWSGASLLLDTARWTLAALFMIHTCETCCHTVHSSGYVRSLLCFLDGSPFTSLVIAAMRPFLMQFVAPFISFKVELWGPQPRSHRCWTEKKTIAAVVSGLDSLFFYLHPEEI